MCAVTDKEFRNSTRRRDDFFAVDIDGARNVDMGPEKSAIEERPSFGDPAITYISLLDGVTASENDEADTGALIEIQIAQTAQCQITSQGYADLDRIER